MENRCGQAAEAQVDGAVVIISGDDCGAGLDVIGRAEDDHARDGAHEGDVLAALVGSAVLEAAARHEHGKAGHERHVTHGGHAGGYADHVLLGNAAVKVTVRELFAEDLGLGGGGQVGIKDDQVVGALAGKLHQRVAVAYTGGNFFHISH